MTVSDGVPSQSLSGGSPSRLLCEGGKWVLEVVRHVNVGHDLIRPTTERLTGNRVITSYFSSNPDKEPLGRSTRELLQTEGGQESRSYTPVGGRWVASSIPPPALHPSAPRSANETTALETKVGDLQSRLVLLSAVQEGLLARLARVEAKLLEWGSAPRRGPASGAPRGFEADRAYASASQSAVPSAGDSPMQSDDGRDSSHSEPAPFARAAKRATRAKEDFGAPPEPSEPAPEDEQQPGEDEAAMQAEDMQADDMAADDMAAEGEPLDDADAAAPEPSAEPDELRLPHADDLAKCMCLLIGGELTAEEAEPMAVNRTTRDCYAANLLDDTDRTVGLILMDLRATVFLGGTLMMLPRGELDQQLESFSPGEDSIAASAEICNALTGAINGAQERHVRASNLEKFDFRRASWVTDPAHRRDLQDSFGGRTVVLSRRIEAPVG